MLQDIENILSQYVKEYQDINGKHIHTYHTPPTPLQFLRECVHPNRPAVIKSAIEHWPARSLWSNNYLRTKLADTTVTVAVTPDGYADAVTYDPITHKEYFVMPYEKKMQFNDFLDVIEGKQPSDDAHYISLQNGSLLQEYKPLEKDVDSEIGWCSEALGKSPDAVNFWFGDSKSVTSLHKDPYENCYAVVRGQKSFILYPPSEYYCMHESIYQNAVYEPNDRHKLELVPLESTTPWIPVNSLTPDYIKYPRFRRAMPITLTLEEGDMLYLPALWFHQVMQQGEEGVIAINYWYDMDYSNMLYPTMAFYRKLLTGLVDGHSELLKDEEEESD